MDIKVGDRVVWDSQAMGIWKRKIGEVIALVPRGESAMQYVPEGTKKSHVKFKDVSQFDRVLVRVITGKTREIAHYYCPTPAILTVVPR